MGRRHSDAHQDEQEKVHKWIAGMTKDLLRMKRTQYAQPANVLQLSLHGAGQSSVKPAPLNRNPSMAGAPVNAPFPPSMGMDPWAEAKMKQQQTSM